MSNYLPNTIDLDKATKKYGNEKNYNILQITYKNFLEIFINSLIDFKSINKIIKDSNLEFKKIDDESDSWSYDQKVTYEKSPSEMADAHCYLSDSHGNAADHPQ